MAELNISPEHLEILRKRKAAERLSSQPTTQTAPTPSDIPTVDLGVIKDASLATMRAARDLRVIAETLTDRPPAQPVSYVFKVERDQRGLITTVRADPVIPVIEEEDES